MDDLECHFFLVKTGCQWRMLPKEFPKWESFITIIANGLRLKNLTYYWNVCVGVCALGVIRA